MAPSKEVTEQQAQEQAQRKSAAQSRRERRQRERERRRQLKARESEIQASREQLRKKSEGGKGAAGAKSSSPSATTTAAQEKKQELAEKKRERRIKRINNTIIMYLGAVRDDDRASKKTTSGALFAKKGKSQGIDAGNLLHEAAKIKEITRSLNDRTYMFAQKARSQAEEQKVTEGSRGSQEFQVGSGSGNASTKSTVQSSNSSVQFILQNEGDAERYPQLEFSYGGAGDTAMGDYDGDSTLFTTDDETQDEFDDDEYGLAGEDGRDDEKELADDVEECLERHLAGAVCKSDDDRQRLSQAKELMRGWIEKEERSRSAEIKDLRQRGPNMSILEREVSREAISSYDNFIYGGSRAGIPKKTSGFFRRPTPYNTPLGARVAQQASKPAASQAGSATGSGAGTGQTASQLSDLLRGFRFYDIHNRDHAFGTSFPGTASHSFLASRDARTRSCLQSQHQAPPHEEARLKYPALWEKFYGGTDSWALGGTGTETATAGEPLRNDCDFAKRNMQKWAERFCNDRDKRTCSFNGTTKDDGGFRDREVEMPDAPEWVDSGYYEEENDSSSGKDDVETTFGTKGYSKPAFEFDRMPVPVATSPKSNIRDPHAFYPQQSEVEQGKKKKNVSFSDDPPSGLGLFTSKPTFTNYQQHQQRPKQPPHKDHQQAYPSPRPPQPSPGIKPSPQRPSADKKNEHLQRGKLFDGVDMSWFGKSKINKPAPAPEPFDGNPTSGYIDLEQRPWFTKKKPSKEWFKGIGDFEPYKPGQEPPKGQLFGKPDQSKMPTSKEQQESMDKRDPKTAAEQEAALGGEQAVTSSQGRGMNVGQPDRRQSAVGAAQTQPAQPARSIPVRPAPTSTYGSAANGSGTGPSSPFASQQTQQQQQQPQVGHKASQLFDRPSKWRPGSVDRALARYKPHTAEDIYPTPEEGWSPNDVIKEYHKTAKEYKKRQEEQTRELSMPNFNAARRRINQQTAQDLHLLQQQQQTNGESSNNLYPTSTQQAQQGHGQDVRQTLQPRGGPRSPFTANPQQAQHEAARAVNQRFASGPIPGISPSPSSSSQAVGGPWARYQTWETKNATAAEDPLDYNLRGGSGGENSSISGSGSDSGSDDGVTVDDEVVSLGAAMASATTPAEKARHAIWHAGPRMMQEQTSSSSSGHLTTTTNWTSTSLDLSFSGWPALPTTPTGRRVARKAIADARRKPSFMNRGRPAMSYW